MQSGNQTAVAKFELFSHPALKLFEQAVQIDCLQFSQPFVSTCATLITRLKKNSTGKLADGEGWLHKSWGQVKGWSSVSFATKNLKRAPFLPGLFSNLLLDGTPGIYMTKHLRPIFSA